MKWSGTNEQRRNASKRVFDEDFEGFRSEPSRGLIPKASGDVGQVSRESYGQKASGPDIGRGDTGQLRGDSGPRKPSGIRSVTKEIEQLISEVKNDYLGK